MFCFILLLLCSAVDPEPFSGFKNGEVKRVRENELEKPKRNGGLPGRSSRVLDSVETRYLAVEILIGYDWCICLKVG